MYIEAAKDLLPVAQMEMRQQSRTKTAGKATANCEEERNEIIEAIKNAAPEQISKLLELLEIKTEA